MTEINENTIEYTRGDTFELSVEAEEGFEAGSALRLVIAENEAVSPNLNNIYSLCSDGSFFVVFSEEDKRKLNIMPYIYKLTLISADGKITTRLSGDFIVKWGA